MNNRNLLLEFCSQLNISLNPGVADKLICYSEEIVRWNKMVNLISKAGESDIIQKHLVDCLTCLQFLQGRKVRLLDIGAGAGLPGLVLKLARQDILLTLLESVGKKCDFLRHIVKKFNLSDVEIIQGRAEVYGQMSAWREGFNAVICRAVGSLPLVLEYGLPFLRTGGVFIVQRGPRGRKELLSSGYAMQELGGVLSDVVEIALPDGSKRVLILVKKTNVAPPEYPRRTGIPKKRPLQAVRRRTR